MLGPGKHWLFVFGAAILGTTLFSFSARAGEPENLGLSKDSKKKTTTEKTVKIEVLDMYGNVHYTDVQTKSDLHIDYDLKSLPVGDYTVAVKLGDKLINYTSMKNVSTDPNVITVEVLNSSGMQVYESDQSGESFDLTSMPKGDYTVNVYKGDKLINANILSN